MLILCLDFHSLYGFSIVALGRQQDRETAQLVIGATSYRIAQQKPDLVLVVAMQLKYTDRSEKSSRANTDKIIDKTTWENSRKESA